MSKLKVKALPVGWKSVSSTDNDMVLVLPGVGGDTYAMIRLVDFVGSIKDLEVELQQKVACSWKVIEEKQGSLVVNGSRWCANYYYCDSEKEPHRAMVYTVLDGYYFVIEMVTQSNVARTRFWHEAKRLIRAVDYEKIEHSNVLLIGGNAVDVRTPKGFRFSVLSTEERLVFLGESKYLFVNVCEEQSSLVDFVDAIIAKNFLGMEDCEVDFDSTGVANGGQVEWRRYVMRQCGKQIGFGTYFRQKVSGESVVSYLYESGLPRTDVGTLLDFRDCREGGESEAEQI